MNEKPNILLIMADQLTLFLTGAYGHPVVKTPNLDKLVDEGVRFDSAYSPCPICSPARNSLMTGKHISTIKCYDNSTPLGCDEPTFAHYLTNEGYDTVVSGKMHFIGSDQLHGFNRRLTTDVFPSGFQWTPNTREQELTDFTDIHAQPIAIDYVTAGVRQWSMQLDFDEETHHKALEYLNSKRTKMSGSLQKPQPEQNSQPFCLLVSYTHPHEPFHVTKEMWNEYENEAIDIPVLSDKLDETYSQLDKWLYTFHGVHRVDLANEENLHTMRRAYYALVTYIDKKVGDLVKTLKNTGLYDNTIIIFCSDHGDMLGEKGMVQKRTFYEWSSRVPLIIHFPDKYKAGKKIDDHVSLMDVAPTILDLAGVSLNCKMSMEATSLVDLIHGSNKNERVVFSEMHTEGSYATCFMVRKNQFKYVHIHGYSPQLFNLENDPGELKI